MVIMCAITRSLENKTSDSSQNVQYTDNTIKIRSIKIVVYIMPTIKKCVLVCLHCDSHTMIHFNDTL